MGYESKLYVVEKTSVRYDGWCYGQVVAMFDLCKCYEVSSVMREYEPTDTYFYADDGNTRITRDCYDDRLPEIPIDDAIEIIREAAAHDDYRRYKPCLAFLEAIDKSQWRDIVVLHYGH